MAHLPRVLMVAEKPSIALSIASVLSHGQMSTRRGSTEVHEFDGLFRGFKAHYRVTSVIGHVFSLVSKLLRRLSLADILRISKQISQSF